MDLAYALAIAALSFLGGLAGGFLRGYTTEKGKNRASKEDLGDLTKIVENIRDTNQRGLAELTESLRAHHSMRSAALEKRLEVHQDAYRMAFMMFRNLYGSDEEHRGTGNDIREWWMRNALYLDEGPRAAFDKAWMAYLRHPAMTRADARSDADAVVKNFEEIRALPPALERAVALPPIVLDYAAQIGAPEPPCDA
jgi:hypothetical protein